MIIYKTTNLINGKIYVGKDSKNNNNYLGSGKILNLAINKYGIENFKKETLCECLSSKELNKAERYWIKKLNSQNRNIGYNITAGGDGGDTITSSPDYKERCLKCERVGKNNGMYGKKHSSSAIKKMSNIRIAYFQNSENREGLSRKKLGVKNPKHSITMKKYYSSIRNRDKTKFALIKFYNNRTEEEKDAHSERSKIAMKSRKEDKESWELYIKKQSASQKKRWTESKRKEHGKSVKEGIKFIPINFIKRNNIDINYFISLLKSNNNEKVLDLKKKFNAKNIQFSIKSILKNFETIENFKKELIKANES